MKKLLALLVTLTLLLAPAACADLLRQPVPFSEMEYESLDAKQVAAQIASLAARLERTRNLNAAYDLAEQETRIYNHYDTMYTLSYIHYDMDNSSDYWYEEYTKNSVGMAAVSAASEDFYEILAEKEGEGSADGGADGGVDSGALVELNERESALLMEYSRILGAGSVEYRGEACTLASMETLDYDDYYEAIDLWLDAYNQPLAEIYAELISVRNSQAKICGYDSYIDMAFNDMGYSYDADMVEALLENIAQESVPVYEELCEVGFYYGPEVEMDFDAYAAALPGVLKQLDRSLARVWESMVENGLVYTETGAYSTPGAYSTYLMDYGEPFIYSPYYGDAGSMSTILHEFGHSYADTIGFVPELDTSEVFSQGLELLAANHYGELFPDEAYEMRYDVAADIFSNYMACSEALFELRAYELENPTAESLNALYAECDEVFQYFSIDLPWNIYSRIWVTISQVFDTPGYMIAYTVSADAALQLWEISLEDEERAVELYLDLIGNACDMPLLENLRSLGLKSAFDDGRAAELAAFCRAVLLDEALAGEREFGPEEHAYGASGVLDLVLRMLG